MIKVTVMYANAEGTTFDFDYYVHKHFGLVRERLGSALLSVTVDKGLNAGLPGSAPRFIAMGHLLFDSAEAFYAAFMPHMAEIQGDIENFTNASPMIQISEVVC